MGDETRLPKWAQTAMQSLRWTIEQLRGTLTTIRERNQGYPRAEDGAGLGLAETRARFRWSNDSWVEVRLKQDGVKVYGSSALIVQPEAANAFFIQVKEF